jgi:hypothetical protein
VTFVPAHIRGVPRGRLIRARRRLLTLAAALEALAALGGCAAPRSLVLAPDDPDGDRLASAVDSPEAHQLLVELLRDDAIAPACVADPAPRAPAARSAPAASTPSQAELNALGRAVSMDFAALHFTRVLLADQRSRPVQEHFARALEEGPEVSEAVLRRPGEFPYTMLFAPGWLYEEHPKSGADFAAQRRLLDGLGIRNRMIVTAQSGSVEANAATIAAAVRDSAARGETVVLVSASKAGPEVAYALSWLLTPGEVQHVAGWLNASAALYGTPLADWAVRAPLSWFVRTYFKFAGWNFEGVRALRSGPSRARLEGAVIPETIAVLNLVAVPVSGAVGKTVRGGYWVMRRRGPTDGVIPIADSLWPGGVNVVALGADHLLGDFRNDPRGLALLRTTAFAVQQHRSQLALERAAQAGSL